jgi:hypothetical protein
MGQVKLLAAVAAKKAWRYRKGDSSMFYFMKVALAVAATVTIAFASMCDSAKAQTIPNKGSPIVGNDGRQLCTVKDIQVGLSGQIQAVIGLCGAGWYKSSEEVTFQPPALIGISATEGKVLVDTNREKLLRLLALIVPSEIVPIQGKP